ncbi:putative bifunctional diguanylate cyclase/phosphodiesterase [Azospira sp. I09]|uniref:putative bifunctional diguanylate cyclase/phosphodiesterase n=1 Tax=Azospira sp. I09 TaxID=1765049 RepID=UPI001260BBE1|nr:EAL domain-containing protein [Azospira sp. I09]BBN87799.1 hypothetical protein AZSP09_08220 [Azospira sp. I09]
MPPPNWLPSIKAKLLALLLLSIFLVLTVVGTLLSVGVERFHREETREVFATAQRALSAEIRARQTFLLQMAGRLAADEALVASLNLVSRYSDPLHYDPLVFDGEKKRLAGDLARLSSATDHLSLVVVDSRGQWVAFGRVEKNGQEAGFLAFDNVGAPLAWQQDSLSPNQWHVGRTPVEVEFLAGLARNAPPTQAMVRSPDGLMLLASAPVIRHFPRGEPLTVGRVVVAQTLGQGFLEQVTRYTPLHFGLLFAQGQVVGDIQALASEVDLSRAAPLLKNAGNPLSGWQETPRHFLMLFSLPLLGNEQAYPLLVLEKEGVNKQVRETLGVLLLVLLLAGALVVPLSQALANRGISRPVLNLLASVERVKAGQYDGIAGQAPGSVEFASLFDSLQDMAHTIRSREDQLRLWASVLEQSREAVFVTDAENRILLVNRAFVAVTGYTLEEARGRTPRFLQSGRHDQAFYANLWRSLKETGHWQGEIWDRAKDGRIHPQWAAISAVADAAGTVSNYIAIYSDLTEHKAAQDRIQFLAQHDPLTGLPNRMLLQDRLTVAIAAAAREGHEVGVLFIDLDRFKTINDSLGHSVGDELIKGVTKRLQDAVRESDTVSRLGGDEFIVVLHRIRRSEDAAHVADAVLAQLTAPFNIAGKELRVTASIGISVFPADGEDEEGLIKNADTAMFHAKERGRNNYQFFRPEMNARAGERLALENSLRGAVQRKEFVLFYQPQVEIRSGRLVGAEALIRWRRGDSGFVSPADFIPLAEETGTILEIGDWVLAEACRQQVQWDQQWPAMGLKPVPVAVNLSSLQFRQKHFKENLLDIVGDYPLPAGRIELELTESIVMEEPEQVGAVLAELKQAGLRLSIDDFGTGYSSLSYLKRFPLDKLKIDASFVRDIVNDSADLAIVHAVVSLGHSLGLKVVAEGVEHEAELLILNAMGCDIAQGYHFCRPVPAEEFQAWVAAYVPVPLRGGVPMPES